MSAFMGIAFTGIVIYGLAKVIGEEAEKSKLIKEQKDAQNLAGKVTAITDQYLQTMPHTPEQTRQAWQEYHEVAKTFVIPQDYGTRYRHYTVSNITKSLNDKHRGDYRELIDKLAQFYCEVACTFHLETEDQDDLIRYLLDPECQFAWKEWNETRIRLMVIGECHNHIPSIMRLADCYYNYNFVEQRDYDKAFALYTQAAKLGSAQAVFMLGRCYENGYGTKKNCQKAGDCYQYAFSITKEGYMGRALDDLYTGNKWDKNKYSPDIFASSVQNMPKKDLPELRLKVEKCSRMDLETVEPTIVAVCIRKVLEQVVDSFLEYYAPAALRNQLDEKITLLREQDHFPKEIANLAHRVRILGNRGAHNDVNGPITTDEVQQAIINITQILDYYEAY